jgi:hypothetical protein
MSRMNEKVKGTVPEASAPRPTTQNDQIREVLLEGARAQLAATAAAMKFWSGWIESADRYTQALAGELTKVSEGEVEPNELIGRVTDLGREYLRDMSELPNAAVRHFNGELEKLGKPKAKRSRAARVKE